MSQDRRLQDYERTGNPNKELLAKLVTLAKGPRSMRQFADELGVNPSTLSRIVNQKTASSNSDELILAISDHADPESGVTLEMLMVAHGMTKIGSPRAKMILFRNIITGELTSRGYSIRLGDEPYLESVLGTCRIAIDIRTNALGCENGAWLFDFWGLFDEEVKEKEKAVEKLKQWMLMYAGMLGMQSRCINAFSVVTDSELLFREAQKSLQAFTLDHPFSIILVNTITCKVEDEYWANTHDNTYSDDFKCFRQISEDQEISPEKRDYIGDPRFST